MTTMMPRVSFLRSRQEEGYSSLSERSGSLTIYLEEIMRIPLLEPGKVVALVDAMAHGDEEAKHLLIKANLRLVVQMARHYQRYHRAGDLLDCIQEGNLGLIRAVETYDPCKGALSTYASWWIYQAITRGMPEQESVIHVPVYLREKVARLHIKEKQLSEVLHREPKIPELAQALQMSVREVEDLSLWKQMTQTTSMDAEKYGNDEELVLADLFADDQSVEEEVISQLQDRDLDQRLRGVLSAREYRIVVGLLGLFGQERLTQRALAHRLSISNERIRQIYAVALKKVQHLFSEKGTLYVS